MIASLAMAAEPVEWRALGGAQVDSDSHGEVDLGIRSGPWVAEIFTDTLDARWEKNGERGRTSLGVRAEAFAAGLLITPWSDGAPDPDRALTASYAGPQASFAWYLPRGLWVGADLHGRAWWFGQVADVAPPPPHLSARGSVLAGWWNPSLQALVGGGFTGAAPVEGGSTLLDGGENYGAAQAVGQGIAPHAWAEVLLDPGTLVAPVMQFRAGYEGLESVMYAPRLGGQMPYVIPLAGAAWAEFQAQTFVATRVTLAVGDAGAGPGSGSGAPLRPAAGRWVARGQIGADVAYFKGIYPRYSPYTAGAFYIGERFDPVGPHVGFLARLELRRGRAWLQAEGAYSPTIPRQEHVLPASAMLRLGVDWGTGAPW